ncbi:MAG: SulP family inorganic anion transporter [Polaromonas sp.]|nr:SulP family inorganic anion transporter [Polaromonas sp.]
MTSSNKPYSKEALKADLIAGLIVAVISIPLGLAFAIASGATPIQGLITSVVAGSFVAIFGGSKFQVAGAAAALIPILAGITLKSPNGFQDVMVAGLIAGVLLVIMGWLRFGKLIEYIPYPVVLGFTSGIAISIVATQLNNIFGLVLKSASGEKMISATGLVQRLPSHEFFHDNMYETLKNLSHINAWSVLLACITLVAIVFGPKLPLLKRIPGALIGLIVGTTTAMIFSFPVETISSLFGAVPSNLPAPSLPQISMARVLELIRPAFTIAVLIGVEALLSAVVADNLSGDRHEPNRELIAQGAANLLSPIFGGMPATGVIARTGANIQNGAQTRVAGFSHAVFVLLIIWLAAPLASQVPMAVLAAILVVVASKLGEFKHAKHLLQHAPNADKAVFLATVSLTVFIDLTVAIEVGMVLASFLFIKHMSENIPAEVDLAGNTSYAGLAKEGVCPQVLFHEAQGPLFFGIAKAFERTIRGAFAKLNPNVYILRLMKVSMMDTTGQRALEGILHLAKRENKKVIFTRANTQVSRMLEDFQEEELLGSDAIVTNTDEAIRTAMVYMNPSICSTCTSRVFSECAMQPDNSRSTNINPDTNKPPITPL